MFSYDDALNLEYYKMTSYTGWMGGMRFLIKKEETADEETPSVFHAWVWPGPYIFDLTDDSLKIDKIFPFTEEGRQQTVDWINEIYNERLREWPKRKTDNN